MPKQYQKRRRNSYHVLSLALLIVLSVNFFQWSNHSLQDQSFVYASPRLPAGFDGCTIIQLSDLHGAQCGKNNQNLLKKVQEKQPDYIFLTGDILDCYRKTPRSYAVELCRALVKIAPTFFVTGNHEWALPDVPGLKRNLKAVGVTVLSNQFVTLERNDDHIILAGIDDPNGYADQKTPEELAREVKNTCGDAFWLLLAHRNNYFEKEYSLLGADLVISGHGHGGLIRLPFTDGLISVERTFFPSYTNGFYSANGQNVFVSRGLGNSGYSFRLFNRPQIVTLTLECA